MLVRNKQQNRICGEGSPIELCFNVIFRALRASAVNTTYRLRDIGRGAGGPPL